MRLTLFIGPTEKAAARLRNILQQQKDALLKDGILAADWNHVRLYAACAAPDAVGLLRHRRGLDSALIGATLRDEFHALIPRDLAETRADHVVLSAAQLGNLLSRPEELTRLRDLLSPNFNDIRIIAHLEEQARLLTAHYAFAVTEGRRNPLTQELALAAQGNWWQSALEPTENAPDFGLFPDAQNPPFWLDYHALYTHWAKVFGAENVQFRPLDLPHLLSKGGGREVSDSLGLAPLGPVDPGRALAPMPAPWLTRMRAFNDVLIRYLQAHDLSCSRSTWSQMLQALQIGGAPITPGSLAPISDHFADDNAALIAQFPALAEALTPDAPEPLWREADPELGFRATQYLAAFFNSKSDFLFYCGELACCAEGAHFGSFILRIAYLNGLGYRHHFFKEVISNGFM